MAVIETYWPAAVPVGIEALWLLLWFPTHVRRCRKQRQLEAIFGPGFFDMTQPVREIRWLMLFSLYHLPVLLLMVPFRRAIRPWQRAPLAMLLAAVGYTGLVIWAGGMWW